MVCDKESKMDDFHYFRAIDKSDPHNKDVCKGDSGGTYTFVLDETFSITYNASQMKDEFAKL